MFYRIDFCDEEAAYLLLSGYSPQDFDGHKLESGWKGARCELVEGELNDFLHCELGKTIEDTHQLGNVLQSA